MFAKFSGTGFKCFRGLEERETDDGLVDLVSVRQWKMCIGLCPWLLAQSP